MRLNSHFMEFTRHSGAKFSRPADSCRNGVNGDTYRRTKRRAYGIRLLSLMGGG